ncbi:MAG: TolC family protein [Flavobacteriaceae bacterium]|nr:TolC family protein [Eudoraea sp.]NNJ38544.1 TolC family protein [Flavobacteriaceae bacterium]
MNKHICIIVLLLASVYTEAQELQSYIEEAWMNNPKIQAFELRYNQAREKASEAGALPNTEFGMGYFISEPETRTGAQKARFSAKQMLPWFGTVSTREKYSLAIAEKDYLDVIIARRKLALSVAQGYYELYSLNAQKAVIDENIKLIQTYEQLALKSLEVGKASAVDVLRLQIRQNELQQQKGVLEEQVRAEQASFNGWLNRNTEDTVRVLEEMTIPEADPVTADSLQINPELTQFDRLYESVVQAELLNQKERAPMLGFGLDYLPVQERPELNISDNGKDILMPMVSLSIPIFNNRFESRTRQNELRKQEIEFLKQERLNLLEAAFAKSLALRNQARISYNAQTKNLKQTRDAEQLLLKSYETGTIDFRDVLDIQEIQLKIQMNQIQSVQLYYKQSAIINYLINT